jgi:hypothetical protein
MLVAATVITYVIVLARWNKLLNHTLNPCGVNSIECTGVQSGDDQAEIAFEKSKEFTDCRCRPVSRCYVDPETFPYVM